MIPAKDILEMLHNKQIENISIPHIDNEIRSHAYIQRQQNDLQRRAEEYACSPIPELSYQDFQLYWQTGDRNIFEKKYFDRRGRLLTYSLLLWLQPSSAYLPLLENCIWQICAEPFWCIPAHFLDNKDEPLPFDLYSTELDLFACETAFALAECLALHKDKLSTLIVNQINTQLHRRVFNVFVNKQRHFRFETMSNNWSGVCASGIGSAAIYTLKDDEMLANILERCSQSLDVFINSFGDDGICTEGVSYWAYGFGFYTCFADLLHRFSRKKYDILNSEKVRAIAHSQNAFYLQNNKTISFSDGFEDNSFRVGLSCYLKSKWPTVALPTIENAMPIEKDHVHRFCLALRDFIWFNPEATYGMPSSRKSYYPDAQWFVSQSDRFSIAAKGGHNAESHNHNDCGSFILQKEGYIMLCDLGAGVYDKDNFSPRRYEKFVNSARSHNIPCVDCTEQAYGSQYKAKHATATFSTQADEFSLALEACYPDNNLLSFNRKLSHLYESTESIALCDELSFATPGHISETFVSHFPFTLSESQATVCIENTTLTICFDSALFEAVTSSEVYIDHFEQQKTAYLLHIYSKQKQTQILFDAKFI